MTPHRKDSILLLAAGRAAPGRRRPAPAAPGPGRAAARHPGMPARPAAARGRPRARGAARGAAARRRAPRLSMPPRLRPARRGRRLLRDCGYRVYGRVEFPEARPALPGPTRMRGAPTGLHSRQRHARARAFATVLRSSARCLPGAVPARSGAGVAAAGRAGSAVGAAVPACRAAAAPRRCPARAAATQRSPRRRPDRLSPNLRRPRPSSPVRTDRGHQGAHGTPTTAHLCTVHVRPPQIIRHHGAVYEPRRCASTWPAAPT